mmetsp:Transcript_20013/g.33016  ORF Transcript_20013/g.33016 Transcript_20013/m.33016 type:complete len:223 (+) Transcript_20013:76-744(+)
MGTCLSGPEDPRAFKTELIERKAQGTKEFLFDTPPIKLPDDLYGFRIEAGNGTGMVNVVQIEGVESLAKVSLTIATNVCRVKSTDDSLVYERNKTSSFLVPGRWTFDFRDGLGNLAQLECTRKKAVLTKMGSTAPVLTLIPNNSGASWAMYNVHDECIAFGRSTINENARHVTDVMIAQGADVNAILAVSVEWFKTYCTRQSRKIQDTRSKSPILSLDVPVN